MSLIVSSASTSPAFCSALCVERASRKAHTAYAPKSATVGSIHSSIGCLATPMMEGRGRGVESFSRPTTPGGRHE